MAVTLSAAILMQTLTLCWQACPALEKFTFLCLWLAFKWVTYQVWLSHYMFKSHILRKWTDSSNQMGCENTSILTYSAQIRGSMDKFWRFGGLKCKKNSHYEQRGFRRLYDCWGWTITFEMATRSVETKASIVCRVARCTKHTPFNGNTCRAWGRESVFTIHCRVTLHLWC